MADEDLVAELADIIRADHWWECDHNRPDDWPGCAEDRAQAVLTWIAEQVTKALRDDALDEYARRCGLFPAQMVTREIRAYLAERFAPTPSEAESGQRGRDEGAP